MDQPSERVGGRGRDGRGQDTPVRGGRPGQGAARPTVCKRMKAAFSKGEHPCLRELGGTLTLFRWQDRCLGQGAGGGGVQDPLSVLIVSRNVR